MHFLYAKQTNTAFRASLNTIQRIPYCNCTYCNWDVYYNKLHSVPPFTLMFNGLLYSHNPCVMYVNHTSLCLTYFIFLIFFNVALLYSAKNAK